MGLNVLFEIVNRKKQTLEASKRKGRELFELLKKKDFFLIGEIKISSPSAGVIKGDIDVVKQVKAYEKGGASAISVVTEESFFKGSIDLLREVRKNTELPVLRKDFIIDPIQVYESFFNGADLLLLISRILSLRELKYFIDLCETLGIIPLVEVHSHKDIYKAYKAGAYFIGINNRDLRTFKVSVEHTVRLLPIIRKVFNDREIIVISESGISTPEHTHLLKSHRVDGILVGYSLLTSDNPAEKIKELLLREGDTVDRS